MCSLVLRFSDSVSFLDIVIVFSFFVVIFLLLLSCFTFLLYYIILVVLSFCFSSLAWGPRWVQVCTPDDPVLLSYCPYVSLRKRQVGGYSPPLDFVTICCSLVPKLRPTRLDYIDFVILSSCSYVLLYSFAWSFVLWFSSVLSFVYLALVLHVSSSSCFSCYLVLSEETSPTLDLIILSRVPLFSCIRDFDPLFSRSSVLCFSVLLCSCHRVLFIRCDLSPSVVLLSCSLSLY